MIRAKTKIVLMTTAALTLAGWRLNQEASPGKHNVRMLLQQTTYELPFASVKKCEVINRVCAGDVIKFSNPKLKNH